MADARLKYRGAADDLSLPTDGTEFTIGRHADNHLTLPGSEVSRRHAAIRKREDGQFVLSDLGSRFGTFVNEERITERGLRHGDRIRLGHHAGPELIFLLSADKGSPEDTSTRILAELRQLGVLLDGLRALGSGGVLEEVLALVVDSAIEVAGADRGFVMLANDAGELEFTIARQRTKLPVTGGFDASRKIPDDVFQTGVTQVISHLEEERDHVRTARLGIRTVLCVPIRLVRFTQGAAARESEQRRIGVLYLDSGENRTLASDWVRGTVETLATEAAVAIENARMYRQSLENARVEQELQVAAEIQRALLPKPALAGRRFAASAASEPTSTIGGDFYDYLTLPGDRVGFVLGDVAGKGPPAALLSALMHGMLSFAAESSSGPADTIARLNRALVRRAVAARFVTLFYGALDDNGVFTYCNAGHNPPLLIGRDREMTLCTGGPLVGLFEEAMFGEESIQLQPGETVVVFSDGISEAMNAAGEEFGEERIRAIVQAHAASAPGEIVDRLFAGVRRFCGAQPQSDDMTVLAIRYE